MSATNELAVCIAGLAITGDRAHISSFSSFKYHNLAEKVKYCQKLISTAKHLADLPKKNHFFKWKTEIRAKYLPADNAFWGHGFWELQEH